MAVATTPHQISTVEELRAIIATPPADSLVIEKQQTFLDAHCRAYISASPFALLATSDSSGRCDVTPRGDGPGFVQVLDDQTLVIPDRPGNRRIDSLLNIIDNPHAGLLFLVPGVDETLRVNGRATLTTDPELLGRMTMQGKEPKVAILLEVEEVFFHCARAFKRGKVWQSDTWIERSALPTLGQIIADQIKSVKLDSGELDASLDESNKRLY